jgi:sulfite exporter TauE/SafE
MFSNESPYLLIFISGFLGGFGHCMGMCGPVVAAYALNPIKKNYLPQLLYNLGRITTYSIIGGIMGLTGSFVGVIAPVENFQNILMGGIGICMIAMGLVVGGWLPLTSITNKIGCTTTVGRMVKFVSETGSAGAFFPMGLILGFIPCGLSYTAFIAAAGAGVHAGSRAEGFITGMSMLFLFGLGTLPALLLLGSLISVFGPQIRLKLYRASAFTMILAGALFLYRSVMS